MHSRKGDDRVKLRNYWTTFIRKDDDFNVVTSAGAG